VCETLIVKSKQRLHTTAVLISP